MKEKVGSVLRYFSHFRYAPSIEEVHTFFPVKISKNKLKTHLNKANKYTLGGYKNKSKVQTQRSKISLTKIAKVRKYINIIAKFPQIRLIGLSGSVAMLNAKESDDIDLFIITAENRIWTARFIVNLIGLAFGLKRSRRAVQSQNKVCLNLFFDELSLFISKKYQTNYMAHEVLQMVPILDVNRAYRRFLLQNEWICAFCPNVNPKRYLPYHFSSKRYLSLNRKNNTGIIGNLIEIFLKQIQIWYMQKPTGDERIENGQLWFHPRDYGRIVGK